MNRRNHAEAHGRRGAGRRGNIPELVLADTQKTMVVIHKIAGIPWVNLMADGVVKGGKDFNINASLIGPAAVDPAQQVKLLEDVIARKVDVVGLVPAQLEGLRSRAGACPCRRHQGHRTLKAPTRMVATGTSIWSIPLTSARPR